MSAVYYIRLVEACGNDLVNGLQGMEISGIMLMYRTGIIRKADGYDRIGIDAVETEWKVRDQDAPPELNGKLVSLDIYFPGGLYKQDQAAIRSRTAYTTQEPAFPGHRERLKLL